MKDRQVMGAHHENVSDAQFHEQLLQDLNEAYSAWQLAIQHFNQAVEPDAIDDAIYLLAAAEKRYEGLIRIARRHHLAVGLDGEIDEAAVLKMKKLPHEGTSTSL